MKNSLKLSLNFLTTKPVVLQALVMKCSNTSALNALLLLLVSLTVVFLKTEFLNNKNTAEFIPFLNATPLMVILILLDPSVLLNIFTNYIPKFLQTD